MEEYQGFVNELKALTKKKTDDLSAEWKKTALTYVDGLAGEKLRTLVPLTNRRESGAFFTHSELANKVLQFYKLKFNNNVCFYDPACGAGNLLIAVKTQYESLVRKMGARFRVAGTDIHSEFIDACKLRLKIVDMLENQHADNYNQYIQVANGMECNNYYQQATHIVTNPPFNLIDAPKDIEWASGKVSSAALFIDMIIKHVKPGTQIVAILPDVLRGGSRYDKWRSRVSKSCEINNIKLLGQFDQFADVDVFSVLLTKRVHEVKDEELLWVAQAINPKKISDLFQVSVGTVVDNRDEHKGPLRPYIVSKGLPGWKEINQIDHTRKHSGKAITSPFVVIKRTSRHGDNSRAVATIIRHPQPVYVDNHLIVLKPLSGRLNDCRNLLKVLKSVSTDNWIDSQIRCRHLTVKVVAHIPL